MQNTNATVTIDGVTYSIIERISLDAMPNVRALGFDHGLGLRRPKGSKLSLVYVRPDGSMSDLVTLQGR